MLTTVLYTTAHVLIFTLKRIYQVEKYYEYNHFKTSRVVLISLLWTLLYLYIKENYVASKYSISQKNEANAFPPTLFIERLLAVAYQTNIRLVSLHYQDITKYLKNASEASFLIPIYAICLHLAC